MQDRVKKAGGRRTRDTSRQTGYILNQRGDEKLNESGNRQSTGWERERVTGWKRAGQVRHRDNRRRGEGGGRTMSAHSQAVVAPSGDIMVALSLLLSGHLSLLSTPPQPPPLFLWQGHNQPVRYLCGIAGGGMQCGLSLKCHTDL